jgi:hypothetical protein
MKIKYVIGITFVLLYCALPAFAQEGGIRGKVRLENGRDGTGVKISVRSGETEVASATTDKNGEFRVTGLRPGSYSVIFEKSGYNKGTLRKKVDVGSFVVELPDHLILKIDPSIFAYVRGSVFDPDGRSVAGASVELWRTFPDGKTKKVKDTQTGESGEFVFRLSPDAADYLVKVKVDRAEPDAKTVQVDGAEIYRLVPFVLKPAAKS